MVGLSYDPKVDAFMEQAGLSRYCLPCSGFDLEAAKSLFNELDLLPEGFKSTLESRRIELCALAWEPARAAVKLLGRRD
jgi:hypothetical protein